MVKEIVIIEIRCVGEIVETLRLCAIMKQTELYVGII